MDAIMNKNSVSIYSFTDFRIYLKEYYRNRKTHDKNFSHRFIQEKVGASSAGWFSDILSGRIALTSAHLVRLGKLMDLRPSELDYLESMVNYAQAASTEDGERHYRRLLSVRETKMETVGTERFEFYTQWWHSAIRELLFFYDFDGDYQALAVKLLPPIKPAQARKSISLLVQLGFIKKNAQQKFRPTDVALRKDTTNKSGHLLDLLKTQSHLGTLALDRMDKDARDISALTLSLSKEGFEKARVEIRALRKRLLDLTEEDIKPEAVYQCNFQMFPITQ
jgi:uncharacterized protein (TIGR02147 family)